MVKKEYDWPITLDDHTRRKLKILREYLFEYIRVRCSLPQQERFRLAIVDGFAGGGRYRCGTSGSPLIFIEELKRAVKALNVERAAQKLALIEIECLIVLNDAKRDTINLLKTNVDPLLVEVADCCPKLHLRVHYMNDLFERAYPQIKAELLAARFRNVLFNLDQCGHSQVARNTLIDISRSFASAEIFYTFMISALLTFLNKSQPKRVHAQLAHLGVTGDDLNALDGIMANRNWLGAAEQIVFDTFAECAKFVSPFSINNPKGWRYWLIHLANSVRARQVYNNILHQNSSLQAHFGRSGLHMLSYNPRDEGALYLFDPDGRAAAIAQLTIDIPRLVSEAGDAMPVGDFYADTYNSTPAHMDDIHTAMIDSPDIQIFTPSGGERRRANTITASDVIKVRPQRSFFWMLSPLDGKK